MGVAEGAEVTEEGEGVATVGGGEGRPVAVAGAAEGKGVCRAAGNEEAPPRERGEGAGGTEAGGEVNTNLSACSKNKPLLSLSFHLL